MTSDETTTDGIVLHLPGIGVTTDWATQYRQNFIDLDDYLSGAAEAPNFSTAQLGGGVTGGATAIQNLAGRNLAVDADGNLNATAQESTGTDEVLAYARRRVTTHQG